MNTSVLWIFHGTLLSFFFIPICTVYIEGIFLLFRSVLNGLHVAKTTTDGDMDISLKRI